MSAPADDDGRWGGVYAVVLGWLVVCVAGLAWLSRVYG